VICVARNKGLLTWFYINGDIARDYVILKPTLKSDQRHLFQQFFVGKVKDCNEEEEAED
jgi:hypothetical protein